MTLLCAAIRVESGEQALRDAGEAKRAGADLVEYRIDGFVESHLNQSPERKRGVEVTQRDPSPQPSAGGRGSEIIELVASSPIPCVVTCRSAAEGGEFTGSDADRAALLQAIVEADQPPRYLDIELASLEQSSELQALSAALADRANVDSSAPRVIVSLHDYQCRPADLSRRLARLRERDDATIVKIAYRARSLRDNLELFEIVRERDRPTIALGMGEFGLLSRVLAPKFGGFLTFASLQDNAATAPGQPTLGDLTNLYRLGSINPKTKVFGVIGWPIGHSLSPMVHNAAFEAIDYDGVYLPMPVPTEWEHFKATLGAMVDDRALDFTGASVTIPHKEHLIRFAKERVDEGWTIDPIAEVAGAGNTIARAADGWCVVNTDAPAIVSCLENALGDLAGRTILILGAGGAARAAAAGLLESHARALITNRNLDRAQKLVDELLLTADHGTETVETVAWGDRGNVQVAAIINTTPVGMVGGSAPDQSPIDLAAIAQQSPDVVVFDSVYNPVVTPMLADARRLDLPTIDGVSLFVRQASLQSTLWTQQAPSEGLFDRLVRRRLG